MIGTTYVESGFLQPRTKGVNAFAVYTAAQRANGRSEESLLNDTLCADYMARRKVELSTQKYEGNRFCYVVTGYTGVGKSEMIRQVTKVIAKSHNWKVYYKEDDEWWQDYKAEELVVFNEFEGHYPYTKFKNLVDDDTVSLRCKGGSYESNIHCIFICSNFATYQWYVNQPMRQAAMRRVKKTWKLKKQEDQERIGKEIIRVVVKDLLKEHQGLVQPEPYKLKLAESYTACLKEEIEQVTTSESYVKSWTGLHEASSDVASTQNVPASDVNFPAPSQATHEEAAPLMLSPSASMVTNTPVIMPSVLSDTSAQFSPVEPTTYVPLTRSALAIHDKHLSLSEARSRSLRNKTPPPPAETAENDDDSGSERIELASGASPVTKMLVARYNARRKKVVKDILSSPESDSGLVICSQGASPYTRCL